MIDNNVNFKILLCNYHNLFAKKANKFGESNLSVLPIQMDYILNAEAHFLFFIPYSLC